MTAEFTPDHEAEARDQALWDEPTPIHLRTNKEVALLPDGAEVFDEIELGEVGDARGKTLLHLQCHIGTDSLASVRHGAVVTGVDFSTHGAASRGCSSKIARILVAAPAPSVLLRASRRSCSPRVLDTSPR